MRLDFVRCYRFILRPRPVNTHGFGCFPRPIENQGRIATAIRQGKLAVLEANSCTLVLDPKVVAASAWGMGIRIGFASGTPGFETGKERLNTRICGMSVQLVGRVPTHQVFGLEPYPFLTHSTPERHQRLGIHLATFTGKFVQLWRFTDMRAAYLIHAHTPFCASIER